MVVVKLNGGIGNQMFQFAAARRVALINNVPLKLDLGWFNESGSWTKRNYELEAFSLSVEIAQPDEVSVMKSRRQNAFFRRLPIFLKKRIFHSNQTHIIEKQYDFDPGILSLKDNVYLDGYWQSYKYFSDIGSVLCDDFSFKNEPLEQNLYYAGLIQASESISLHVRRGDYVSSSETNAYHGVCSLHYYQEAVRRIVVQVADPVFFVFSDDIEWAKENLPLSSTTYYVDCNGPESAYEDMRLMSLCNHHIIANSSFSWWGAWLGANPDKTVIAPKRWFSDNRQTPDNIPESWLRL